mmetsp:Transcript_9492/g.19943  ORF Transcript_9492/g.19943 Transcript_9492/m.19943 type:complete len:83 (-) Transcript_9492:31-279(-)
MGGEIIGANIDHAKQITQYTKQILTAILLGNFDMENLDILIEQQTEKLYYARERLGHSRHQYPVICFRLNFENKHTNTYFQQ